METLNKLSFVIIFVLISFLPYPLQEEYHLTVKGILLVLCLAYLFLERKGHKKLFCFEDIFLWIYLVGIGCNVFFAYDKNVAFKTYMDLSLVMFCIYYIFSSRYTEDNFIFYSRIVCLFSLIVSFWGIMEVVFRKDILYECFISNPYYARYMKYFVKPMSLQFNPTPLSAYLAFSIFFCFFLYTASNSIKDKLLSSIAIILNVVCFIVAWSRGSLVAMAVVFLFYLWIKKKRKMVFLLALIFLAFSFLTSYLIYPLNILSPKVLTSYGIFSSHRVLTAKMVISMLEDKGFFFGVGLNNFRILFDNYYQYKELWTMPYELKIPDNMYVTLLVETGIIGLTSFLIFIFYLISQGMSSYKHFFGKRKNMLLTVVLSLIALLFIMFGYDVFYWHNQYIFFCLLVGLTGGLIRSKVMSNKLCKFN